MDKKVYYFNVLLSLGLMRGLEIGFDLWRVFCKFVKTNIMNYPSFEDFAHEVWSYPSHTAVNDEFWNNNQDFIRELTYEYYKGFERDIQTFGKSYYNELIKRSGKMLEATLVLMIRYPTNC